MESGEEKLRTFVEEYDIEVPADRVEEEYRFILLDMRHRAQYDRLATGNLHLDLEQELADQESEYRKLALYEVKSELVIQDVIKRYGITAEPEELLAEAEAMAERDSSSLAMVRRFFGEDLSGLASDVKRKKAMDIILGEAKSGHRAESGAK